MRMQILIFTLYILGIEALPNNIWIYFIYSKKILLGDRETTPFPKQGFSPSPALHSLAGSWHLGNSLFPTDALGPCSGIHSPIFAMSSFFFYLFSFKRPMQEVVP